MVILAIITISIVTYSRISDIIVKRNIQYTKDMVYQLKQNISANYKEICTLITNVGYDRTVQDFMMETEQYNILDLNKKISSIMDIVKNVKSDLIDISIVGGNNSNISLRGGNPYVLQFRDMIPQDGKIYCSEFRQIDYDTTESCFLFGVNIFSIDQERRNGEKIGFVCAVVDVGAIYEQINRLPKLSGTSLYLVDKNGRIFSDNKLVYLTENDLFKNIDMNGFDPVIKDINEKKNIVQVFELPEISGKIVTIVPVKELYAELSEIQRNSLVVFAVAFLFISVPLSIMIKNIVSPLKELMNFMREIRSGNLKSLKKRVSLAGNQEISVVANEFNSMLDEIDGLTHRLLDSNTRLYEIELKKKQSELAFLQSQINPHFLYNTLESIRGMASSQRMEEIKETTRALSLIFRYSVKGTEDVYLREEIEIVKSYLMIQQMRFQNRFDVEYHLNPEALECMVPKMILQPLVENAIYHGLEPTSRKGNLNILCDILPDRELVIRIKDNGVGISGEKLEKITADLSASPENTPEDPGIGMVNVNNRLKLIYGDSFGIEVISKGNDGTEVIIHIPARRQTDV